MRGNQEREIFLYFFFFYFLARLAGHLTEHRVTHTYHRNVYSTREEALKPLSRKIEVFVEIVLVFAFTAFHLSPHASFLNYIVKIGDTSKKKKTFSRVGNQNEQIKADFLCKIFEPLSRFRKRNQDTFREQQQQTPDK